MARNGKDESREKEIMSVWSCIKRQFHGETPMGSCLVRSHFDCDHILAMTSSPCLKGCNSRATCTLFVCFIASRWAAVREMWVFLNQKRKKRAERCRPAHKRCTLFLPTSGSTNGAGEWGGTVSWVPEVKWFVGFWAWKKKEIITWIVSSWMLNWGFQTQRKKVSGLVCVTTLMCWSVICSQDGWGRVWESILLLGLVAG